jgi:hypothetical protein
MAACAGGYSSSDQLTRRVTSYNEDVRWGRYFSAAEFVNTEARDEWLQDHRLWRQDLRIADYEVVDSTMDEDSATVLVMVTWYRMNESVLQTTMLAQRWERVERQWILRSEELEDGTPITDS